MDWTHYKIILYKAFLNPPFDISSYIFTFSLGQSVAGDSAEMSQFNPKVIVCKGNPCNILLYQKVSRNRQIWQRIKIMPSRLVDWEGKISF